MAERVRLDDIENENTNPNGAGRKTKYTPDVAEKAYKLSLLGLVDLEMIAFFNIVEQTWYNWQHQHPELVEAIRRGKTDANSEVAYALFRKATGYQHPDVYIFSQTVKEYQDGKMISSKTVPLKIPLIKYYPPDTAAGCFWLKNRTRKNEVPWLEIARTELTGKNGGPIQSAEAKSDIDLSDMTDTELEIMEKIGFKIDTSAKLKLIQGGLKTGTDDD